MPLIDTGPLVALIVVDDPSHARTVTTLRGLRSAPLVTIWSCLTEAMYLLSRVSGYRGQAELMTMILDASVTLHFHSDAEIQRIDVLMRQYLDAPMDLADASLVVAVETLNVSEIVTLDAHFRTYRLLSGRFLNVFP